MLGDRSDGRLAGANIEHAGEHNQRVVLRAIRAHGPITKAELARLTGLTHPTVSNITSRLSALGLLSDAGLSKGARGQPGMRLTINTEGAHAIGVNIDRDHITMVLVDFGGRMLARATQDITYPTPEQVQNFHRREIDRLLAGAGVERSCVVGIGVALPDGLGDVELPGRPAGYGRWSSTPIETLFAEPLRKSVVIENDAAAAAIGEMQFGRGQRFSSFFHILITYAMGGGLVVHGRYHRGADGRSGEIGFMMVEGEDGRPTQLQNIVSLAGLSRQLATAGLAAGGSRAPDLASPAAAQALNAWIESAARALIQPLVAVNCLINPEAVLIGGRLPVAILDRLAQRTNALLRLHGRNAPVLAPVQAANLAEDAAAMGAALLPFGPLLGTAATARAEAG